VEMERDQLGREKAEMGQKLEFLQKERAYVESRREETERKLTGSQAELETERAKYMAFVSLSESRLAEVQLERDEAARRASTFDSRERELLGTVAKMDVARRTLHNRVMQLSGNMRVYVRIRPPLPGEAEKSVAAIPAASSSSSRRTSVIRPRPTPPRHAAVSDESPFHFPGLLDRDSSSPSSAMSLDDPAKNVLVVTEPYKDRGGLTPRQKKWSFNFDGAFGPSCGQEELWEATEPLVQSVIDGFNVCIFAYGQTGSGKTHTMLGDDANPGIVTRAVNKLFDTKSAIEGGGVCGVGGDATVDISVELLEIYNERVRDLLAPDAGPSGKELNLRLNSNEAVGNVLVSANSREEVRDIMDLAQRRRCVKATQSNAESSRSHMIFTLHFVLRHGNSGLIRRGKLHVCDLAGSERLSKSGSMGTLLKETKHINTSLAVLSNVIEKLQGNDKHVPYRESKLTYLLKNSLGGDSKTLAIVCCNPLPAHFGESMCSLRFAAKANRVELKATGNFSC